MSNLSKQEKVSCAFCGLINYADDKICGECGRPLNGPIVFTSNRMTPEKLAEFRELVKFGSHLGVGGPALELLLDEIQACWDERSAVETKAPQPSTAACEYLQTYFFEIHGLKYSLEDARVVLATALKQSSQETFSKSPGDCLHIDARIKCPTCGIDLPVAAVDPIHLSKGGRDPDEKIYSARTVEALVGIALACNRHKNESLSGGLMECAQKASVRHLPTCNLNYIDGIGEGCDCGAENGKTNPHD